MMREISLVLMSDGDWLAEAKYNGSVEWDASGRTPTAALARLAELLWTEFDNNQA